MIIVISQCSLISLPPPKSYLVSISTRPLLDITNIMNHDTSSVAQAPTPPRGWLLLHYDRRAQSVHLSHAAAAQNTIESQSTKRWFRMSFLVIKVYLIQSLRLSDPASWCSTLPLMNKLMYTAQLVLNRTCFAVWYCLSLSRATTAMGWS